MPLAKHIPLAVLSAILMMVAYNMGEWREIPEILKLSKADISVWFLTFSLTVFADLTNLTNLTNLTDLTDLTDLTLAVEVGMILAALLYIVKVTGTSTVARVTPEYIEFGFSHSLQTNPLPDGVVVYRIHGPFLFGAADRLKIVEEELDKLPSIVILRLRNMTAIDATGLNALENLAGTLVRSGRHLILCGMRAQPAHLMTRADFHRRIGVENICISLKSAVERAKEILITTNTPQS